MRIKIKKFGYLSRISRMLRFLRLHGLADKYEKRLNDKRAKVKFDYYDTWSLDHTLAQVIYPALIEFKNKKHGSPFVELEDVPENLRPENVEEFMEKYNKEGEIDELFHARWTWAIDEMIYAFHSFLVDWEDAFYENGFTEEDFAKEQKEWERINNGLRLFAKYYSALWD